MKNLKDRLKEIANALENKIANGEFEFINCEKYTVLIKVEDLELNLWIAHNGKYLRLYDDDAPIFTNIGFFETLKSKEAAWKALKPFVDKHNEEVIKKEKLEQYKKLQKELGITAC